jgi:hypothetical protein
LNGQCAPAGEAAPPGWPHCTSQCDTLDATACKATPGCQAVYGSGEWVETYRGCWATSGHDDAAFARCSGLDAEACVQHDSCRAYRSNVECDGKACTVFESCDGEDALYQPPAPPPPPPPPPPAR